MVNLSEGQYQLGDLKFGRGTLIPVSAFEVNAYSVTPQDYQVSLSDEMRFGQDSFTPAPIVITMAVMKNAQLPHMASLTGKTVTPEGGRPLLESLQREWRADEIRRSWNFQKPLILCRDGITQRVYGRPRKFSFEPGSRKSEWINIVADFQRSDTCSYSEQEFGQLVLPSSPGTTTETISRLSLDDGGGLGNSWLRFLIQGPIVNPQVKVGNQIIYLATSLSANRLIEISTYPWDRRIVNSDGQNLSATLVASSPYLDQVVFPASSSKTLGLAGTSTNADTKMYALWRESYLTL